MDHKATIPSSRLTSEFTETEQQAPDPFKTMPIVEEGLGSEYSVSSIVKRVREEAALKNASDLQKSQ